MKKIRLAALSAAFLALSIGAPAYADIDTTGSDAGNVAQFGASDTATYGQTFTAGAGDTAIATFSMFLRDRFDGSGTLDLKGYIAEWDGFKAGTLLYSSGVQTMNASGALQEFAFAPGISIAAGGTYVAFLSISDLAGQPQSTFQMPISGDTIAGQFVFQNNGTDFNSLFTNSWSQGFLGQNDAWLKVGFGDAGAVPEPSAWALMILGFGVVGAASRRRTSASRALA